MIKHKRTGLAGYVLLLSLFVTQIFLAPIATAQEKFKMTVSTGAPLFFDNGAGFFDMLTAEIFKRLDIEYEMIWLPPQRSLVYTDNGTYDGHIARTQAIETRFPNLVRVPVNIFDFDFMAFTKNSELRITSWESLLPYSVGIMRGWKIVEQNTDGAKTVIKANDYSQLLNMLEKGRVEVAILDRVMGGWHLNQLGYEIAIIEPAIVSKPNFIYVHKKHIALVPRMVQVIEEIKLDGTFDSIYAKSLLAQ